MEEKKIYKKGDFIAIGMAIGIPIALIIGWAIDNISTGLAISIPMGFGIGLVVEKLWDKNPMAVDEKEKKQQEKWALVGFVAGLVLLVFFTFLFSNAN